MVQTQHVINEEKYAPETNTLGRKFIQNKMSCKSKILNHIIIIKPFYVEAIKVILLNGACIHTTYNNNNKLSLMFNSNYFISLYRSEDIPPNVHDL